ncbi:Low-complexity acidic protein [Labilithrix luteola]|uniref:Low-complexity acidic protein n=1 Tax=Labilithrix luteola TaxID=1391654 RepID=A0A0K1PQA4_9BACT|nr:hypothetical protein [Labilithrix luteola]AKU95576.1 Low-complexity acidic protein [Labilithrix luteola]
MASSKASEPAWLTEARRLDLSVGGKKWRWKDGAVPDGASVDEWKANQGNFKINEDYLDFVRRYGTAEVAGLKFFELDECGTAFGLTRKPSAKSASGLGIHVFARAEPIKGRVHAAVTYEGDLLSKGAAADKKAPVKFTFTLWEKWLDGGPAGPTHDTFDGFMAWWLDVMKQRAASKEKPPTKKRAAKNAAAKKPAKKAPAKKAAPKTTAKKVAAKKAPAKKTPPKKPAKTPKSRAR